jgi:hypothetical protein
MTKDRLGGMTGDIINKHIKKYVRAGAESIFIATNLPPTQAQKLETVLKASAEDQHIALKTLQVIPGNIETLLQFLDKLANKITKRTSKLLSDEESKTEEAEEIGARKEESPQS